LTPPELFRYFYEICRFITRQLACYFDLLSTIGLSNSDRSQSGYFQRVSDSTIYSQ